MSFPRFFFAGYFCLPTTLVYFLKHDEKVGHRFPKLSKLQSIYLNANENKQLNPSKICEELEVLKKMKKSEIPSFPDNQNYNKLVQLFQKSIDSADCSGLPPEETLLCSHLKSELNQLKINSNSNGHIYFR